MALRTDFKIGADTSGFRRGLASVRNDARKLAHDINKDSAKSIGRQLKGAIGPIAVGGAAIAGAKTLMEESKAVRDNAAAHKLSIEEEQAAEIARKQFGDTANVTAEQFAEAVKKIIESGQVMSTDVVREYAAMQDQLDANVGTIKKMLAPALLGLAETMVYLTGKALTFGAAIKNSFLALIPGGVSSAVAASRKPMQAEEDRQDYVKRQQAFNANSREVAPGDTSPSRFNQFLGRNKTEVKETPTIEKRPSIQQTQADALQRIGLGVGGLPVALIGIHKQQLAELKAILNELKGVKTAVEEV